MTTRYVMQDGYRWRARKPFLTSISGILMMCARAEASRKALDKAHKRRTRGQS